MECIDEYALCVYWGIRPESREVVADNLTTFLNRLSALDDSFLSFFPGVDKKPKKIPFDKYSITAMLTTNQSEIDNTPIPDLGFRFLACSGLHPKFDVSISAKCGLYTKSIVNSVVISFNGPEFPSMELIMGIYSSMKEIFQPEAGVVRIYEKFILDGGKEKYKSRILESFGAIDKDGKVSLNQSS